MFEKKCSRCRSKIKKNFDFCPFCGNNTSSASDKDDFGLIGKSDFTSIPMPFGNSMIEKMFNNTMKMLEKQMKSMDQEMRSNSKIPMNNMDPMNPNLNVQFFVNGKRVFPPQQGQEQIIRSNEAPKKIRISKMPQENLERFSKLPKKEPISKFRRIGNKLIYELEVPGVNDLEDILINRLENSIEIKALAKDKSYCKILNINLPILRYGLDNGNLIIELQGR